MLVKGSIGETCTVEAKIVEIRVSEEGTFYDLLVNGNKVYEVEENLISFSDYFVDPAEYGHKLQEAAFPEEPAENRIMEYTYGMLTAEKFGLQHLIKSMIDEMSEGR